MTATHDLILIPGLLNNGQLWHQQVQGLTGIARVHIGNTLAGDDSINAMAKRILNNAPATFALGGMSMGGYVALEILKLAPERVTKLALVNTHAHPDDDDKKAYRRRTIKASQQGEFLGVSDQFVHHLLAPDAVANPNIVGLIQQMGHDIGRETFALQQTAIMNREDKLPLLPQITVPTLLIAGDQDQIIPRDHQEDMLRLLSNCPVRFEVIANCGHLAPLEHPKTVTKLFAEWLG